MSLLIYCYGPLSVKKSSFCSAFADANPEVELIQMHRIRKKITGSLYPQKPEQEREVIEAFQKKIANYFKKNKSVIVDGLLLNKSSRMTLLEEVYKIDSEIKKVAISFQGEAVQIFEDNKSSKDLKNITFDIIRSQAVAFKVALNTEEADLLVEEISTDDNGSFSVKAKLWEENRTISCKDYTKMLEFFKFAKSY